MRSTVPIYLFFFFSLLTGIVSRGQDLSGLDNYAINRPGVVMVRAEYSANVYVNSMKMNSKAFNALLDSIQRLDQSGGVSAEQKLDIVLREMNIHPTRFIQTTFDYIKQPIQITSTGTGFLFSADGYVATNCHLIDQDNAYIRKQFILSAFQQITDASIAALETSWAARFTEQQRSLLYNTYASVYSRLFSMILYDLKKNVSVVYAVDRQGKAAGSEISQASIVIKGKPMPGKDIAILKMETDKEMPVLSIAGPRLPRVGEKLFVYGYPAPVTHNDFLSAQSAIEPTLTTGIVSAIKTAVDGWPLFQMDANINHGSSGGPVCNARGEVIGLTTFGSLENTGGLAAGLNFAIPVTILNEFLDSAGITPVASRSSGLFSRAVNLYKQHHYRDAWKALQQVQQINSGYPGLYSLMDDCNEQIAGGNNVGSAPVERVMFIFSLLVLASGLVGWWRLSRWA